ISSGGASSAMASISPVVRSPIAGRSTVGNMMSAIGASAVDAKGELAGASVGAGGAGGANFMYSTGTSCVIGSAVSIDSKLTSPVSAIAPSALAGITSSPIAE